MASKSWQNWMNPQAAKASKAARDLADMLDASWDVLEHEECDCLAFLLELRNSARYLQFLLSKTGQHGTGPKIPRPRCPKGIF